MVSRVSLARAAGSLAMINGGGRRRGSSRSLALETVDPTLEVDRFRL